jgi:hypothetical protein
MRALTALVLILAVAPPAFAQMPPFPRAWAASQNFRLA